LGASSNPADNSGILRYVRIEYAGYAFLPDKEINGLTFGGVGNGTVVDYVQVSYANDYSFEWFGGTVNCKHLISFRTLKSGSTSSDYDRTYAGVKEMKDSLDACFSNSNVMILGDYNDDLVSTISTGSGPVSSWDPILKDSGGTKFY
jgi:hypothetical protein